MNLTFLRTLALTLLPVAALAQINSFPYTEGFESGDGQYFASGTDSSWAWGQPTQNTFIRSAGSGARAWVTNLSGTYNANEASFLTTPVIDCTSLANDPFLQFLQIFELDSTSAAFVDVAINGGDFQRLGSTNDPEGINWYNGSNDSWRFSSGTPGIWRPARRRITGAAGNMIQIRFGLAADRFSGEAGFGIDDVQVFEALTDLAITRIVSPTSGPLLSPSIVEAEVTNTGTTPITDIPVTAVIDGPSGISEFQETFPGTIQPNQSRLISLATLPDLSAPGTYTVSITANFAGDQVTTNNSQSIAVIRQATISSLPYFEGFESGGSQFIPVGTSSSWEVGRPRGALIATAATGQNAWVTNLNGAVGPDEESSLQSPPIDCTALASDPFLTFNHIFQVLGSFTEHVLEMSVDGSAFALVGSFDEPGSINWYNAQFTDAWTGTSDQSGTWRTARVLLRGAAGSVVTLRWTLRGASFFPRSGEGVGIDDIQITEVPFGEGQPPGRAELDINQAVDRFGFPVSSSVPGPYFAAASSSGEGFNLSIRGEPNQPAVLLGGTFAANTLSIPGAGQLDLSMFDVLLNGAVTGGLNPFFLTNATGELRLSLTVPIALVGNTTTFQALVLSSSQCPVGFCLTNAVQVSFAP